MLKHLYIRDFAVIEELELRFDSGMTVFTGETGAGKSIIVDALGLVLGDRAESIIIRKHCEKTEITAILEISRHKNIIEKLEDQDIDCDDDLILRRVINQDGRSRAYINGSGVTVGFMREIGEQLIDIHGQHAHQSLMKQDVQRSLLDDYGLHTNELKNVRQSFQQYTDINYQLEKLSGNVIDLDDKLALLDYQVNELERLNLEPGELDLLNDQYKKLSNVSRILESGQNIYNILAGEETSIRSLLHKNKNELHALQEFDDKLGTIIDLLENATIQIDEATDDLRHYLENTELDPEKLQFIEDRISAIHDLSRKHKVQPAQLHEQYAILSNELDMLRNNETLVNELQQQRIICEKNYSQAAKELHNRRLDSAIQLSREVTEKIQQLGMPGGKLEIAVKPIEKDTPLYDGLDNIEFLVSINPGQDLLSIKKVASGGELSRISLAIQVVASKDKGIPTLIFDEVDAGIGGGVAEIVGKLLHDLAAKRQICCVTHLPQVASLGDHHMQVNKTMLAGTTLTQVMELDREERVSEIARMLGGVKITDQTRAHAREMLNSIK